jgi:uncharacterized protein YndB with AHSA1/START domain
VTTRASIVATSSTSLFRRECAVSADIAATPERIWQLLTDSDGMVRWNSTLTSMAGTIGPGGTVRMEVPEAPGTVFEIEVTSFKPPREMVWTQGNPIMFRGVRTHRLTPVSDDLTKFEMVEVFSGLALPMAAGRLPDFQPIFERYAADLRAEAERGRTGPTSAVEG